MRRRLLVPSAITAALLVTGGITGIAGADVGHRARLHAATTQSASEIFDLDVPNGDYSQLTSANCAHSDPNDRCVIPFYETDDFTGDLVGQEQGAGVMLVTVPFFVGEATSLGTYTGTVKGCPGPGTAILRNVVTMGAGGPGINLGTVEVVAGSGTGGLSTLRGHGDVRADIRNGTVATLGLDFTCANGH